MSGSVLSFDWLTKCSPNPKLITARCVVPYRRRIDAMRGYQWSPHVTFRSFPTSFYLVDVTEWQNGEDDVGSHRCNMCGKVWDEKYVRPVGVWENTGCCLEGHPYHDGMACKWGGRYERLSWCVECCRRRKMKWEVMSGGGWDQTVRRDNIQRDVKTEHSIWGKPPDRFLCRIRRPDMYDEW